MWQRYESKRSEPKRQRHDSLLKIIKDIGKQNKVRKIVTNTNLQERIAIADNLDGNAAEALKLLLESAPKEMTTGLEDWTLEEVNGQNVLFYKGKNYIPRDTEL